MRLDLALENYVPLYWTAAWAPERHYMTDACARCAELEARFKDPATPNPGAFLYGWATHHLDDHGTQPEANRECPECLRFSTQPWGIRADLWARWAQTHFMKCQLASGWGS